MLILPPSKVPPTPQNPVLGYPGPVTSTSVPDGAPRFRPPLSGPRASDAGLSPPVLYFDTNYGSDHQIETATGDVVPDPRGRPIVVVVVPVDTRALLSTTSTMVVLSVVEGFRVHVSGLPVLTVVTFHRRHGTVGSTVVVVVPDSPERLSSSPVFFVGSRSHRVLVGSVRTTTTLQTLRGPRFRPGFISSATVCDELTLGRRGDTVTGGGGTARRPPSSRTTTGTPSRTD